MDRKCSREEAEFSAGSSRFVSLHDKRITQIVCAENSVEFHFENGFSLVDGNNTTSTKSGYVRLCGCSSDDFCCSIIKRKASRKGAKLHGKPISLKELGDLLSENKKSIEIFLELYNNNCLYWRGDLYPYKKRGLNDWVIIEIMDFFSMTYDWEE